MRNYFTGLALIFWISACTHSPQLTKPKSVFFERLQNLCGQAFEGAVISKDAMDADWRKETLVMHVRACDPLTEDGIKIALHVGENRSRTWILRDEGGKLALRHDHRHEDGTPDSLTYYGGFVSDIKDGRIDFSADESTKALFDKEGIPVSKANIWTMEIESEVGLFVYTMRRPNRFFRAEFNITRNLNELPPTPWGW